MLPTSETRGRLLLFWAYRHRLVSRQHVERITWTGPSRNNPGSLDHGDSVCRLSRRLEPTLSAVTAAVVGGVINLAVWFGLHVIFPSPGTIDWFAHLVGLVAFTGMVRWKGDIARWNGRLVRLSLNLNQLIHLAAQC